jgi:hypothetical protein
MLLPKLGGSWLLPPWDFPHQMRVTLWITTAIHLDTPNITPGPFPNDGLKTGARYQRSQIAELKKGNKKNSHRNVCAS